MAKTNGHSGEALIMTSNDTSKTATGCILLFLSFCSGLIIGILATLVIQILLR